MKPVYRFLAAAEAVPCLLEMRPSPRENDHCGAFRLFLNLDRFRCFFDKAHFVEVSALARFCVGGTGLRQGVGAEGVGFDFWGLFF